LDRAGKLPALLRTHARPTVPADVEKCADGAFAPTDDDQAFLGHLNQEVVAGVWNLLGATDADPALLEDALGFRAKHFLGDIVAPRQRARAGTDRRPDIRGHELYLLMTKHRSPTAACRLAGNVESGRRSRSQTLYPAERFGTAHSS